MGWAFGLKTGALKMHLQLPPVTILFRWGGFMSEADHLSRDAQEERAIEQERDDECVEYVTQRFVDGVSANQLADELASAEWSEEDIDFFVGDIYNQLVLDATEARAGVVLACQKRIYYGLLWMVGGAAVSFFLSALVGGGGY